MADEPPDDALPRITVNRSGLRWIAVSSLVVMLALVAALLAQDGLFSASDSSNPDGLTTLALILAILAFVVQIVVFLFQTHASQGAERRSRDLNAETREVLTKIEASSSATEAVLISHFERLLDFVVGGPGKTAGEGDDVDAAELESLEDDEKPATAGEVRRLMLEASRLRERPTFPPARTGPSSRENQRELEYLREWPSRDEAEKVVAEISKLPPLAVAALTRAGVLEIRQRLEGRAVGLNRSAGRPPFIDALVGEGLLWNDGGKTALTDRGRQLARILPIKPSSGRPEWFDEVITPIASP
jgi:uncharacterized membrane protein